MDRAGDDRQDGLQQDTVVFEGASQQGSGATAGGADAGPQRPTGFAKEIYKLSNVALSSALVALLRAFSAPPTPPTPPNAESLPAWYLEEYAKKAKYQLMAKQYVRDTILLTGAAYLMEGVEGGLHALRGVDDVVNKVAGGMAAGGMMGYAWFPSKPGSRGVLTATGAVIGYVSYTAERAGRAMLLEQQRRLEKEVLGLPDDQGRKDLDPDYMRDLIRRRQKQLADAADIIRQQQQQQGMPRNGSGSPAGPTTPGWVQDALRTPPGGPAPAPPSSSPPPATELQGDDAWGTQPPPDTYPSSSASPAAAAAPPRRGFWRFSEPRGAAGQSGQAGTGGPGAQGASTFGTPPQGGWSLEMRIEEPPDVRAEDEMRQASSHDPPGSMFIKEEDPNATSSGRNRR